MIEGIEKYDKKKRGVKKEKRLSKDKVSAKEVSLEV